ncbi:MULTISPECIES: hypothetical protein [Corynebacterium]|uniref:hypothetical protein n=1 Tax=Corynebacterium TaxID=1716 RepID=UPI0010564590|nr:MULTISPECIES: hypothetical protein [Corynebacterium]MCG7253750.1 hypothetical protein [Corynebacterium hadale]MCG7255756.1 hypothetical protein [Corynebacterium hadale]MCG7264706.1 hypothetical protein [Corynebacterium hadale]TVX82501.1 hypothetical protein FPP74_00425 [Corynebacterium sp. NML180780]
MITGVDGVLCPPGMAIRLVERHRFSGRCTARRRRLAQPLRAARRVRLSQVNLSGGNDTQIAATYSAEDVAKLRATE